MAIAEPTKAGGWTRLRIDLGLIQLPWGSRSMFEGHLLQQIDIDCGQGEQQFPQMA
ncbi:MAG: hypothetical protein ACWGKN_02070 [Desulfoprunum sp.]